MRDEYHNDRSFCPSPWDGTWTGTIPNLTCGTGPTTFTMTISKNGNNFSGNASWDNIPCLSNGQCVGVVNDSSGSVSGSISSCSTIQINYTGTASGCGCGCDGRVVQTQVTGTRNGRVIRFTISGINFHFTKTSPPSQCRAPASPGIWSRLRSAIFHCVLASQRNGQI